MLERRDDGRAKRIMLVPPHLLETYKADWTFAGFDVYVGGRNLAGLRCDEIMLVIPEGATDAEIGKQIRDSMCRLKPHGRFAVTTAGRLRWARKAP